jgi:gliding motility-associated-like protein
VPTVLTIANSTLFIPNGFSPNGDGKNDVWFIKGLPKDTKVTIFNRWGNKVYQKDGYDNTWDGRPNVSGTLGTDKLSQGTYYYIIEFNDGKTQNANGFVVIQY